MDPKELISKVGSVSLAALALLTTSPTTAPASQKQMVETARAAAQQPTVLTAFDPAKLLLAPASDTLLAVIGHGSHRSHSSHSSHSSHRSGSGHMSHASHYSHRSSSTSPPGDSDTDVNSEPEQPAAPVAAPKVTHKESAATLSAADLAGMSDRQLWLLRNEYYARHGYSFSAKNPAAVTLKKYFAKKPWYHPDTDESTVAYSRMSATERANLQLILKIEKQRKAGARSGM